MLVGEGVVGGRGRVCYVTTSSESAATVLSGLNPSRLFAEQAGWNLEVQTAKRRGFEMNAGAAA